MPTSTQRRLSGLLSLYPMATRLAAPLVDRHLARRVAKGKEDGTRIKERKGEATRPRPDGPLVWLHGASVGESLSVLPLIERLRRDRPDISCLVTTGTLTSARLLEERLPAGAFHQFVPLDHPAYVKRFLDHWCPDLTLWIESEFWPNLLAGTRSRSVPVILINARISEKSFRSWQRFPKSARGLMQVFDLVLAQTDAIAARLTALGARAVEVPGNLKLTAAPLPCDDAVLADFQNRIANRPVWLAASTHDEEEILVRTQSALQSGTSDILTLVAPRQPDRGAPLSDRLSEDGTRVALRSKGEALTPETQVYIADTIGEMGLFYRLTDLAFIGRTFAPLGGSNPFEAVQLGCAVLHGAHTDNFSDIFADLDRTGAARRLDDPAALAPAIAALLNGPQDRTAMIEAGQTYTAAAHAVLDTVMDALAPYMPQATSVKSGTKTHARA